MKQTINIGAAPDDGTGDVLRTAFDKVNDNFNEVYSLISADILTVNVRYVTGTYVLMVDANVVNTAVGLTAVQAGIGYTCIGVFTKPLNPTMYYWIVSDGSNWNTVLMTHLT